MRDYQTKANQGGAPDSITSTKLGAGEANSILTEAKTAVSRAGLTPAGANGAGEDTTQLAQALFINAVKASSFLDSGSANAYRLTPISGSSGVLLPGGYGALNGMRIYFVPSANNTGNTTINIGQTVGTLLGSKKALTLAGGEIPSGALLASRLAAFTYNASADGGNGAWILDGSYDASGQFLPLTGGTMSGPIAMGSNKITGLGSGTNSGDAVNKGQLDLKLDITGGTMSGPIAMGSSKITGLGTPTNSGDATTKGYVDGSGTFATNGYRVLPGGLIIQWGSISASGNATADGTFPLTFPNNVYHISASGSVNGISGDSQRGMTFPALSTSGFTIANDSTADSAIRWIAVGR